MSEPTRLEAAIALGARCARVLRSPSIPPALAADLGRVFGYGFDARAVGDHDRHVYYPPAKRAWEPTWARYGEIAEIGLALLDPAADVDVRVLGCQLLTSFPTREVAEALARILADPSEPVALRDQAGWTLGYRQAQERDDALLWSDEARAVADGAIAAAVSRGDVATLKMLAHAARHVDAPVLHEALLGAPIEVVADVCECFAAPALARRLLGAITEVPAKLQARAARLVAHVLGGEAAAELLAAAPKLKISGRVEAMFAALAVAPERARAAVDAMLEKAPTMRTWRARAELATRTGRVLPVAACAIARTTAAIARADRPKRCAEAAADFASLYGAEPFAERTFTEQWRHVAFGAAALDPSHVLTCVEADPTALDDAPFLVTPYLDALARAGRFEDVLRVAESRGATDVAVRLLASAGRPRLALAARAHVARQSLDSAVGAAVALFDVGHALAPRALALDPPRVRALGGLDETFPGLEERFRANLEPERSGVLRAAIACVEGPVFAADRAPIEALAARVRRDVPEADAADDAAAAAAARAATLAFADDLGGARVVFVGEIEDRAEVVAEIEARNGRVSSRGIGKVDAFVAAQGASPAEIAKLTSEGSVRLRLRRAPAAGARLAMPKLPRPRRVTFLVPRVRLDTDDPDLARAAATLLALILRRQTIVSRALTTRDAFEIPMHPSGVAVVGGSEAAAEVTPREFTESQRDEVVWLDLDLRDPDRATARVKSELPKGDVEDFSALGGGEVSDGIARALQAWRAARGLEEHAPPLTSFGRGALLTAARALADADKQPMIAHDVAAPPELAVFFLRALAHARACALHDRVLALDPDEPWTLLDRYVRFERPANPRDFAPLDRVLELAPLWPLPYGHRHGEAVDVAVELDAASFCAWLDPGDDAAFSRLALALARAHRYDEAVVIGDRAARLAPWNASHHRMVLAAATDRVRVGASLATAERRFAFLRDLVEREGLNYTPDHRFVALIRSSALLDAGRFDEAIAARAEELGESAESWPQQSKILETWRTSPTVFARAYAREAYFRGDPGRALEGFAAARPETAVDAAAFVASFTALGQDDLATIAFANLAETPQGRNAATRMAGARAMLARGELAGALDQLHNVSLRSPRRLHDARIVGILRVASPVPAAAWEAVVRTRLDVGALRLARMAARDAADFCSGVADGATLREALGEPSTRAFDSAWLVNVRAAVETPHAAMIDALFHDDGEGVRSADVLVERWVEVARVGKPGEDAAEARIAYVLANALGRYLVATTRAPDAWSGGLRAVAIAAMAGLEARPKPARAVVRGLLEVLEAASLGVDAWLLDGYLLQLERALALEDVTLDHVAELADGLPRLGELLRGDLAIGRELAAARAYAASGDAVQALPLFERSVRATLGDDLATAWAEVAARAGTPREAIDAAWTALASNPFHAGPAITIAKAAFADGEPEIAYDVVTRYLGRGGKTWRDARVIELSEAWAASGLDVPLDFDDAQEEGLGALQTGDGDRAARCYAVCAAQDPKNATVLKNVAMAEAARGRVEACVAWFSRADVGAAPTWAAHQLMACKKWPEALRASRYAERWYEDAQSFIYQANAAWFSGDDDEKLRAILRADALDPTKVAATYLNGAAEVFGESGRYAEAEAMANRLLAAAGEDATFRSLGEFQLAVALLGQGRAKDALEHAERAVALNPLPDNAAELADVRDRCARGEPKPKVARKGDAADARAFAALEGGDPKAVAEIARGAATGRLGRAALAAECHRFESDSATPVTKRRISAARDALTATRGSLDVDDSLAREAAMRALEDVYFPSDPPPVLGVRPSRARLHELFPRR